MGKGVAPQVGTCGCAVTGTAVQDAADAASTVAATAERHAVAVDPTIKQRNLTRLRRIEGQVRGLQKMVEEERWCADVLTQVASVQEALRSVSRELLRNHLKHCAATAVREDEAAADAIHDELVDLMFKYAR